MNGSIQVPISLPNRDLPELAETMASWYNPGEGQEGHKDSLTTEFTAFCPWCNCHFRFGLDGDFFWCKCCDEPYGPYLLEECWECERKLPLWIDEKFCSRECAESYGYKGKLTCGKVHDNDQR